MKLSFTHALILTLAVTSFNSNSIKAEEFEKEKKGFTVAESNNVIVADHEREDISGNIDLDEGNHTFEAFDVDEENDNI